MYFTQHPISREGQSKINRDAEELQKSNDNGVAAKAIRP